MPGDTGHRRSRMPVARWTAPVRIDLDPSISGCAGVWGPPGAGACSVARPLGTILISSPRPKTSAVEVFTERWVKAGHVRARLRRTARELTVELAGRGLRGPSPSISLPLCTGRPVSPSVPHPGTPSVISARTLPGQRRTSASRQTSLALRALGPGGGDKGRADTPASRRAAEPSRQSVSCPVWSSPTCDQPAGLLAPLCCPRGGVVSPRLQAGRPGPQAWWRRVGP